MEWICLLFTEQERKLSQCKYIFEITNIKKNVVAAILNKQAVISTHTVWEKKIKLINNDKYTFCIRENETLEHVLYECAKVHRL